MLLTYLDRIKPGHAFPDVRDHEDAFVSACISVLRLGSWLLGSGIMQRHGRGGSVAFVIIMSWFGLHPKDRCGFIAGNGRKLAAGLGVRLSLEVGVF